MRSGDLWLFLFLLGVLVFNWPFLTIFEKSLPTSLFTLWLVFIGASLVLSFGRNKDRKR